MTEVDDLLALLILQALGRRDACGTLPRRRFGARTGVFLFVLVVLVVLEHAGLDLLTTVGLVMVASCLTAEVSARVFGFPPLASAVA